MRFSLAVMQSRWLWGPLLALIWYTLFLVVAGENEATTFPSSVVRVEVGQERLKPNATCLMRALLLLFLFGFVCIVSY